MRDVESELRDYYEEEARQRVRKQLRGRRVELRDEFITLLAQERRWSVLDFGAGPGLDGQAFVAAGCSFVGVDLAHGNAVLAAESGITVVHGSISAPPLRNDSFDAGWSMSTLMHVPEDEVVAVLAAMTGPLRPGAPLIVGLWGGARQEIMSDQGLEGRQRYFNLRPFESNQAMLETCGALERSERWDLGPDEWEYHVFLVRVP